MLGGRLRRLRLAECLAGISLEEIPVKRDLSKGYVRQYTATLKFFGCVGRRPHRAPRAHRKVACATTLDNAVARSRACR